LETYLVKSQAGLLPADPPTEDWYRKLKVGGVVRNESTVVMNPAFFRKYFALLRVGFENWQPGEIDSKYGTPMKNFERFRKDVAILCGYYDMVIRIDGTTRPEAKSISFARMEEPEFTKLYSATIDLFLKRIYSKDTTAEELDKTVQEYLRFA
jgi:hypothetical protein